DGFLLQARAQVRAFEELHREIGEPVVLAAVEGSDDAGMVELAGGLRLEHEALLVLGTTSGVLLQQDRLQGDLAIEVRVVGPVDDAHRAAAELTEDLVASDLLLGHQKLTRCTSART